MGTFFFLAMLTMIGFLVAGVVGSMGQKSKNWKYRTWTREEIDELGFKLHEDAERWRKEYLEEREKFLAEFDAKNRLENEKRQKQDGEVV